MPATCIHEDPAWLLKFSINLFVGNLTFDEVDPVLTGLRDNLTSVQSSIEVAQDTVEKLDYLEQGFDTVSEKHPCFK